MSNKGKAETYRLRGRNFQEVVQKLVEEYNSSNGWSVTRVIPNYVSLEVWLERNSTQAKNDTKEDADEKKEQPKATASKTQPKKTTARASSKKEEDSDSKTTESES